MSITRRRRSLTFMALGALIGAILIGHPAQGAMSVLTGSVSSSNGPVTAGLVQFFATCQDYEAVVGGTGAQPPAQDDIYKGAYSVNIPDGTYLVRIRPADGSGAGTSWHNAQATCEQAEVVTVKGYTVQNLVTLPGSEVTGTVSTSNGPVTTGLVQFIATCQGLGEQGSSPAGTYVVDPRYADEAMIDGGRYSVTVPDGTYRVLIQQPNYTEHGAMRSWHNAKPTCDEADVVTVSGNTTLDLVPRAGFVVTGTVRSRNGPVWSGYVSFFRNCEERPVFASEYSQGDYMARIFAGTYRVLISPDDDNPGALLSWHNAKPTCEQADVVSISGDTTQNVVALPGKQTVKKPPTTLKQGRSARLAKASSIGARVTWKGTTRKVCRVKKFTVTGLAKGTCVLKATVPKKNSVPAYAKRFTIRVR